MPLSKPLILGITTNPLFCAFVEGFFTQLSRASIFNWFVYSRKIRAGKKRERASHLPPSRCIIFFAFAVQLKSLVVLG